MPAATEITSTWLNTPATEPVPSPGGHFDINLQLAAANLTATGQTTAIDVEGGVFAEMLMWPSAAITGTTPTFDTVIEASVDGGSTYKSIGKMPQVTGANLAVGKRIARPVFIPRPTGTNRFTKVRLNDTVAGTTPVFPRVAFLRDMGFGDDSALGVLI
jgi:hypothetical protein